VVIRAAIKLAAEPGTTEGGSLLRVRWFFWREVNLFSILWDLEWTLGWPTVDRNSHATRSSSLYSQCAEIIIVTTITLSFCELWVLFVFGGLLGKYFFFSKKSCGWVVVVVQQEFANRLMVLSADNLQQLVACLHTHSLARNNSLQVLLYPFI
jgi:hypothetical protein